MMANVDVARHGDEQVRPVQAIRGHAEAGVADELAQEEHAIGALDRLAQRGRGHDAEIRPDKLRMQRRKHAPAQKRRRDRDVQPFGEPHDLFAQMKPVDLDAHDEHRPFGGIADAR